MKQLYTKLRRSRFSVKKLGMSALSLGCILTGTLSAQSYTFTPAGATGSLGPTQAQATGFYSSTNLNNSVTVPSNAGIQYFTIPTSGMYRISALGAQGGGADGGFGALIEGDFNLNANDVIRIVVGQLGQTQTIQPLTCGGGGGSYVMRGPGNAVSNILVIAGGGGGSPGTYSLSRHASLSTSGNYGAGASNTDGAGGINGNGGNKGIAATTQDRAAGGGGFFTDGQNIVQTAGRADGGKAFLNGSNGGSYNDPGTTATTGGAQGGFGGGGAVWTTGHRGGGGGGGYSGGGGGQSNGSSSPTHCGGGGGSYNSGANPANAISTSTGDGMVVITKLCSITITVTGLNGTNAMCAGNSVTLTTNAISNYSWSNGATTSSIVVSPATNTVYSLSAMSPSNCITSEDVSVTVSGSLPALSLTNTAFAGGICPTNTVILTASGAITYTWAGGSITPTNGVAFGPIALADYTVTGENGCGTTTAVTSVSVHPFPSVTPSASSSTLCAGSSLTLTATGNATNYVWSGGSAPSGNGVGFVPPPSTITYSVIGTSALSCTAQATIPVTVHATPNQIPSANPALICIGGSSTLTAAGALSYTWASSTQTVYTPAFTVTPTGPGVTTYTVTKSNSTCADTRTVSVTTNALPTILAMANPAIVCALQPSSLTIGGGSSYTWTSPGTPNFTFTGASPVVYPQSSTEYTVAASDGTCISLTTVSVTANANPTITTSSSPSICLGQQVTINANGGNSYTWTVGSNTFTGAQITDSPTTAVAYNVTGDNASGCTASAQQIVLVYPVPATTASSGKPLSCNGGSVVLTAGGAHSYTWDANAGGAMSPTVVVYPNSSASGLVTYTVTGSFTTTGCEFSKTVQVSVYVPTLSVSGVTNACAGGQISLSASGGNANTYSWNTGSGTFNFPSVTTTVSGASVFTVTANTTSLSATCQATRTVAIGIYPNPTVTATAERGLICPKESTNLYADGAGSYLWSNSMSGGTITVFPTAPTNIYSVIGTDGNGCVSTATVQVKLQTCTGISETGGMQTSLLIYPNPNTGEFKIVAEKDMNLRLINDLGQVVRTFSFGAFNDHQVEVKDLAEGIYFITGEAGQSVISQKIIVK